MTSLNEYLSSLKPYLKSEKQEVWFNKLKKQVASGYTILNDSTIEYKNKLKEEFTNWTRTEELKAWYGEPEGDSLFQGTSVSSLTIPATYSSPLEIKNISDLENQIANAYIRYHNAHKDAVINASFESVDNWLKQGLFYGFVVASKVVSQAFNLSVDQNDVIFSVDGVEVDPHEILSYPINIRKKYFEQCREKISCFKNIDITQQEFEESLILSDISKPKIKEYTGKLILGPIRCNEICTLLSKNVCKLIKEKTDNQISPKSLMVTIYDSDTPYTYHKIAGWNDSLNSPTLPGLTLLGSSGTIDSFRWNYIYRVSLISQKIMKSSLYSETKKKFMPFVFFGVLVERDANILIDLDNLDCLRYFGNISPTIEYHYLMEKLNFFISGNKEYKNVNEILKGRVTQERL